MGPNNPMSVEYFTYKVEFQERGAGHIHGTLWLDLKRLEKRKRLENGQLTHIDIDQNMNQVVDLPFKHISSAFRKIKNNLSIDQDEKMTLKNFVDEFTTVCTNVSIVGESVSRIVQEVNKHSHTKACRKYETSCRFNFPRFPSIRTIIAEPVKGMVDKERKEKLKGYQETMRKVGDILKDGEKLRKSSKDLAHQSLNLEKSTNRTRG